MKQNFDPIFKALLGHEGGYSDDPRDRGSYTKYGVTIATLRAWRRSKLVSAVDVKALKVEEAKDIFRAQYWDKCAGDKLPHGLDYAVVDFAYNSGVDRSLRALQRQLRVDVDGVAGAFTIDACCRIGDSEALRTFIKRFQANRLAFLKTTYGWKTYKNGWSRRVREVEAASLAFADGQDTADVPSPLPIPTARDEKVALSPQKTANEVTGIGTIGTIATDTAQKLAPHVDALAAAKYMFLVLTVLGMLAAMYLAYQKMTKESG